MAVSLEAFVPQVIIELPQCPEPVALAEIRNAVIELCDRALVWREDIDPLTLELGEAVYDLDTPPQARVATVMDIATDDNRMLMPVDQEWLIRFDPSWRTRTGRVDWFTQPDSETLRVIRVPEDPLTLFITCAFAPTRNGNLIPSYVFEQYLEVIKYGAWARLMVQPSKPWTNLQLAMRYGQLFSAGMTTARVEATKGRVRTNTTVVMKPFA
jgi:hypothetical protein